MIRAAWFEPVDAILWILGGLGIGFVATLIALGVLWLMERDSDNFGQF